MRCRADARRADARRRPSLQLVSVESLCRVASILHLAGIMTKSDIVDRIAQGTGLTKLETEAVVDGFLKTVVEALCHDEHVELRGFGTFRVKERAPRTGRNPRTGQVVELDEQYVPHFKVSRELRQLVDRAIKSKSNPDQNENQEQE
jgi:DNA-binding protein HU-beta